MPPHSADFEGKYLAMSVLELETADQWSDEVRRFYAVQDLTGIASNSDNPKIAKGANAALEASLKKAKRYRKTMNSAERLKAASRSIWMPSNAALFIEANGDLLVYELPANEH